MKVTTDVGEDKCSSNHGGTSAAAPNAAGVFALALQARWDCYTFIIIIFQRTHLNDFSTTDLT